MQSQRILHIDVARGLGIILVVLGHAERGLASARIADPQAWQMFDMGLYTFHMPLFMLLAGLNVPGSLAKGRRSFITGKLWTVGYPYVLWSLVQVSLLVAMAGHTNSAGQWSSLLRIGWDPVSPFWFLYALLVYMLVVAATGVRTAVLVPLAGLGLIASAFVPGDGIARQLCYQAPFFVIGVVAADAIKGWTARAPLLWAAGFATAWLAAFRFVPVQGDAPYLTPVAFPAACAGIACMFAVAQAFGGRAQALLARLGQMSMTIYVMHILATAGTRIIMVRAQVEAPAIVYLIACTAMGLAAPVIVHLVLERMGLLPAFGLARPRPERRGSLPAAAA
ncbi:acyltransferase [Novosphingobium flavum]|uniref:Acyltransferase n=1 Tax=Novosphingobium flavum TaxID=1778672 RepID=A0A7X1FQN4_9SPHN|nr:acyltransferase [Novosphingobium flavum]MBC2665168.1 acyltransferase [Novosphingobium flavum]